MCNHLRSRPTSGASLRGKVQDGSKSTHPCRHLVVPPLCAIAVLAGFASAVSGAELRPETIAAFNRYVALTEQRMDHEPFLIVDALPEPTRQATVTDLRSGGLRIEPLDTRDAGRRVEVPGGLIHHWIGDVFLPGVSVQDVVALLQGYDHHAEIYAPVVTRSRLLKRVDDSFRFYLRFTMKKVITVVVNSEHEAKFSMPGPERVEGRIHSLRIAEVDQPNTPEEREKPVGNDGGYLWRLNTYWRLQGRDGGTYVECESVSLTRNIPTGFGWLVRPFVTSIPRESLTFTLRTTQERLIATTRR